MSGTSAGPPTAEQVYEWNKITFGEGVAQNYALIMGEEIAELVEVITDWDTGQATIGETVPKLRTELGDVAITLLCLAGREGDGEAVERAVAGTSTLPRGVAYPRPADQLVVAGGQVLRAVLKREQGIRAEHDWSTVLLRAVAGTARMLRRVAEHHGQDLAEVVTERWTTVSTRDATGPRTTLHQLADVAAELGVDLVDGDRCAACDAGVADGHTCGATFVDRGTPEAPDVAREPDPPRPAGTALYEQLASIQHDIWSHWMRYLLGECVEVHDDGSCTISVERANAWWRQIDTSYADLTEAERSSDREQVDRFWGLVADDDPADDEMAPGKGEFRDVDDENALADHALTRVMRRLIRIVGMDPDDPDDPDLVTDAEQLCSRIEEMLRTSRIDAATFAAERDAARSNLAGVAEGLGLVRPARDDARGALALDIERRARLIFRQHQAQQADEERWNAELTTVQGQLSDLRIAVQNAVGCLPGDEIEYLGHVPAQRDAVEALEHINTQMRDRLRADGMRAADDEGVMTLFERLRTERTALRYTVTSKRDEARWIRERAQELGFVPGDDEMVETILRRMFDALRAQAGGASDEVSLAQHVVDALATPADDGVAAREIASRAGRRIAQLHGQVDGMRDQLCRAVGLPLISDDGPDARWTRALDRAWGLSRLLGRSTVPVEYVDTAGRSMPMLVVGERVSALIVDAYGGRVRWPGMVAQLGPALGVHGLPSIESGGARVVLDPARADAVNTSDLPPAVVTGHVTFGAAAVAGGQVGLPFLADETKGVDRG